MSNIIVVSGLCLILLWLHRIIRQRVPVVGRYKYLELLSFECWKTGQNIREEMEEKKRFKIDPDVFHADLMKLEKEGLIRRRINPLVGKENLELHEFRRAGDRQQEELRLTHPLNPQLV